VALNLHLAISLFLCFFGIFDCSAIYDWSAEAPPGNRHWSKPARKAPQRQSRRAVM